MLADERFSRFSFSSMVKVLISREEVMNEMTVTIKL